MIPVIDDVEGLLALLRSPAASEHDGEPLSIVELSRVSLDGSTRRAAR